METWSVYVWVGRAMSRLDVFVGGDESQALLFHHLDWTPIWTWEDGWAPVRGAEAMSRITPTENSIWAEIQSLRMHGHVGWGLGRNAVGSKGSSNRHRCMLGLGQQSWLHAPQTSAVNSLSDLFPINSRMRWDETCRWDDSSGASRKILYSAVLREVSRVQMTLMSILA